MDDFDLVVPEQETPDYDYLDYTTGNDLLDIYLNNIISFISQNIIIILLLLLIVQLLYGFVLRRYLKNINYDSGNWKCFFPFIRYLNFYRIAGVNQLFACLIIGFVIPFVNIILIPLYFIVLNYVIFKTIALHQDQATAIKAVLCNIFIPLGLALYLARLNHQQIKLLSKKID